jgi:hypothetical protein
MMRRLTYTAAALLAATLGAQSAQGQQLINPIEGGLEADWIVDPNFQLPSNQDDTIDTNVAWEWWGGTAWDLIGWENGAPTAPLYYGDGQYAKDEGRDFTLPHFSGQVPAFTKQHWSVTPGGVAENDPVVDRVMRMETDTSTGVTTQGQGHALRFFGGSYKNNHFVGDAAPAGSRVHVRFDYVRQHADSDLFRVSVVGLSDNNPNRMPYFDWDDYQDDTDISVDTMDPGPDYIAWEGQTTGVNIDLLNPDGTTTTRFTPDTTEDGSGDVWDWQTAGVSFIVPDLDPLVHGTLDNLAVLLQASGKSDAVVAIDNLMMYIVPDGDANEDNEVDLVDFGVWKETYLGDGVGDWTAGNFNGDDVVDLVDFGIWKNQYLAAGGSDATVNAVLASAGIAVPEPTSFILLGLGAAAMVRLRHRAC